MSEGLHDAGQQTSEAKQDGRHVHKEAAADHGDMLYALWAMNRGILTKANTIEQTGGM